MLDVIHEIGWSIHVFDAVVRHSISTQGRQTQFPDMRFEVCHDLCTISFTLHYLFSFMPVASDSSYQ